MRYGWLLFGLLLLGCEKEIHIEVPDKEGNIVPAIIIGSKCLPLIDLVKLILGFAQGVTQPTRHAAYLLMEEELDPIRFPFP